MCDPSMTFTYDWRRNLAWLFPEARCPQFMDEIHPDDDMWRIMDVASEPAGG